MVGNDLQSWPAWRSRHGDQGIPRLIENLRNLAGTNLTLVLSGHSGGGSLIFGFLNAVNEVPASVCRLAFLDANYAYRRDLGHTDKLARWLRGGVDRSLCVLAYDDASALLNGKTFVSADGGTWGCSHAMVNDLRESLGLVSLTNGLMETHSGLAGRAQFLLRQNPERKVWHTVLVERNGLIHAFQAGTPQEGRGYEYLGPRAYDRWISPKLDHPITELIPPALRASSSSLPTVEKVTWCANTVWLDKAQTTGFRGVPENVWNFHIGGYQVCEKWLKDRKGRGLTKADLTHYQKIIVALSETIHLMQEIDALIEKHGGWPLK